MEGQRQITTKLPYKGLKKSVDLIHLDRPILTLYKNNVNDYFFLYLIDTLSDYDEYILWKSTKEEVYKFFKKRISFKELILSKEKEFVFHLFSDYYSIDDFDLEDSYTYLQPVQVTDIEKSWLPHTETLYSYGIPEQIREELTEIEYLESLRENATFYKVEPRSQKYGSTVSSLDAASFLIKITTSFINYASFDFKQKFTDFFTSEEGFLNSEDQLKSSLIPRLTYAGFGSFEVALSVDTLNPALEGNKDFFAWQREVSENFKNEVIDFNYSSIGSVDNLVQKYPPTVRRQIFKPLFEIADNPKYTVSYAPLKNIDYSSIDPVEKEVKRKITYLADETQEQIEDERGLELMTVLMAVPQGTDLASVSKKSIKRNTLSVTKSNTKEDTYSDEFTFKGKKFTFINPIKIRIETKGLHLIILCDIFSIEVSSPDKDEAYRKLQEEIYNYYFLNIANNLRSPEAQAFFIYLTVSDE